MINPPTPSGPEPQQQPRGPDEARLTLPGRLAAAAVESRLTPLILVGLLLLGAIGLAFTPREENPQIVVPAAEVSITLPGAFPEEVEHLVLSPLEAELGAIDGVKHLYGIAAEGVARVVVEFEVGGDKEDAFVRLYDRMLHHRHRLPPAAGEPRIEAIDVDDVPVFTLTLAAEHLSDAALRRVAERVLERLRSVSGVGAGYLVGGRSRELRIEVLPERLQAYGVSLNQIADAVAGAEVSQPLGQRVYAGENRTLRLSERIASAEALAAVVVHREDGRILHLGDLARVLDGSPQELTQMTRFAFGPADTHFGQTAEPEMAAVTLALAKRAGVNAVQLNAALRGRGEAMRGGFLPPEVHAAVTRDDGLKADRTVRRLVEHLLVAIGAVTTVLWLFLGWRAAALVAVTIPLVFAAVMGADLLAGPTLNRIILYALILALGMLVDDAIVVTESTHRHYRALPPNATAAAKAEAAALATSEIGNPTTLATFTVVVVFLSLVLVTGMLGQYFYPITFNVPVAMVASLVVAYSVTPWLARRLLPTGGSQGWRAQAVLQRGYRGLITPLLQRRGLRHLLYLALVLGFGISLLQPAWQFLRPQGVGGPVSALGVPLAFLPKDNTNSFLIHLHLPETTPLEVTDRAARELGELLRQQPSVRDYQTHVGLPAVIDFNGQLKGRGRNVGPQYAEIRVNLIDKQLRGQSSIDLVRALRPEVEQIAARYPSGLIQLVEDPPGPPVRATVLAEVNGPEPLELAHLARRLAEQFRHTHDMAEVWASVPYDLMEYRIGVDRERAALAGVDPAVVTRAATRLLAGEVLGEAHPPGERLPVPIRLQVPRSARIDPGLLARAYVHPAAGPPVPLSEVTRVTHTSAAKPINLKRAVRVRCGPLPARGQAPLRRNSGYAGVGNPGGGCNSRPLRYFTRARESTRYQRCSGVNCSAVWRRVLKKAAISRQALSTQAASACG